MAGFSPAVYGKSARIIISAGMDAVKILHCGFQAFFWCSFHEAGQEWRRFISILTKVIDGEIPYVLGDIGETTEW